jgi:hypothetical protein
MMNDERMRNGSEGEGEERGINAELVLEDDRHCRSIKIGCGERNAREIVK